MSCAEAELRCPSLGTVWVLSVPIPAQSWSEAACVTWEPAVCPSWAARGGSGSGLPLCLPLAGVRDVPKRVSPSCWLLGDVPGDGFSR